jgi:anti-anti-sigma factor
LEAAVSQFGLDVRASADGVIIFLTGELDLATEADLRKRLVEIIRSQPQGPILVEVSKVSFMDARTLQVLAQVERIARRRGRTLRVGGVDRLYARIFHFLGIGQLLAPQAAVETLPGDEL